MPRKFPKPQAVVGEESFDNDDLEAPLQPTTAHVVTTYRTEPVPKGQHGGARLGPSLTPAIVDQVKLLVAAGVTIPVAAQAIGLTKDQWAHYQRTAKQHHAENRIPGWGPDESPYLVWGYAIAEAKAAWEASMVLRIGLAARTDWKAASWLLERRAPDRWYPKKQVDVTVKNDVSQLPTEQLIDLANKDDSET